MGYGIMWRLAHASEARLIWDGRFPVRRLHIDVKFLSSLELQILRCRLHGLQVFDPKVVVCEPAFPRPADPEWEAWYQNIEVEYNRAIDKVLPEFLSEHRAIKSKEVPALGREWGVAAGGAWHQHWPDHAEWALGQFIRVARAAGRRRMCVFATHYG